MKGSRISSLKYSVWNIELSTSCYEVVYVADGGKKTKSSMVTQSVLLRIRIYSYFLWITQENIEYILYCR